MVDMFSRIKEIILRLLRLALFYKPEKKVVPMPTPTPQPPPEPRYKWSTPDEARHSVRLICDEEGLSYEQKNELSQTVHCESGYNPKAVNKNIVNGKVVSIDYGIAQINDYWHMGPGKEFPSPEYVLENPEACIRWMCKQWRRGEVGKRLWVCYGKGLYKKYAA